MMTGAPSDRGNAGGVRIEPAAGSLGDAVAHLHAALIDPPWSAESVRTTLAHPATLALAAIDEKSGDVAGFVILQVASDEAEILAIAVVPSLRRKGLARRLLEAAEAGAGKRGARRIHLEVAGDNEAARELYGSAGYAEAGRRAGYYRRDNGPACDALLLSRAL
jgi:ribosomal-protein-alanine N-acetyltransferase